MINFVKAIGSKFPNVGVRCEGDTSVYANVEWVSGDPIPTEQELIAAWDEILREESWLRIKAERDKRKGAGILVDGNWFHSDDASRIQQIALTMLGSNLPTGIMWKTMTGSFVEMTPSLAVNIFQTNIAYDKANFANAEVHRQAMLVDPDPENYDYSSGWWQSYEDAHPNLSESQLQDALM